jgi:hypothetical protein
VHAPREEALHSGVVCFSVEGVDGPEAVERLFDRAKVQASVGPYEVQLARLGTCWINTEDEVEAAIRGVRSLT